MSNNPLISLNIATDAAPGAVPKVVENGVLVGVRSTDGNVYPGWDATGANIPAGPGTEVGQSWTWDGNIWVPGRDRIRPSIDPTGVVDATAAILAAANSRPGAWIDLPFGSKIKVGSTASPGATIFDLRSLPKGTSITGSPRGLKSGSHLYNDGNPTVGVQLQIYGTGKLFDLGEQMHLEGLEFFYPNQVTSGAPTVYGWMVNITQHGCSVHNCTAINPYDMISIGGSVGGADIDKIWGFPFHRGVYLGRVTDVARINRVNLNPAANWQTAIGSGSDIPAWVAANGVAFVVDGAEAFQFGQCFAYGYGIGLSSNDEDGDTFRGAGGSWWGGGFDTCTTCVRLTRGMWQGLVMSDISIAPIAGQYGILFEDTTAPGAQWERVKLTLDNCRTSGVHYRTVQMAAGAYGICSIKGGQYFGGPSSAHFGNDSATAAIYAREFEYDSSYALVAGTGSIKVSNFRDGNGV